MAYDVMLEKEDRIKTLGWADTKEEAEQAYLKKHEENYRRQGEGY